MSERSCAATHKREDTHMPVVGFPDPDVHLLCRRCRKWHEPQEGSMRLPDATGPLCMLRNAAAKISGDTSGRTFICFRCQRIRRLTNLCLWGLLAALAGGVILAQRLGLLQ